MKTYSISYSFDGFGVAMVRAKNEQEAREKFYDGDCEYEDNGDNYVLENIQEETEVEHGNHK